MLREVETKLGGCCRVAMSAGSALGGRCFFTSARGTPVGFCVQVDIPVFFSELRVLSGRGCEKPRATAGWTDRDNRTRKHS